MPRLPNDPLVASSTWRHQLLEGLLRTTAVLMTFALPAMIIQTRSYTRPGWTALAVAAHLVVIVGCLLRRLPYPMRALTLLFGIASLSWLGLVRVGYQVGPGVGCAMAVVTAGLLLGRAALFVTYVLMTATFLAFGVLHGTEGVELLAWDANDPRVFGNWVRTAFAFALFAGVLATAVMFVVSRIEGSLAAHSRALDELRAEQAQREQAQCALARANEQIVQMHKLESLGRLAGGVAHDFNNALGVILGWTDLIRMKKMSQGELERALDQIGTAASSAARLTQQLLSFGRKAVHVPRATAVDEVIGRVIGALAQLVPANITLHSRCDPDLPRAWVDPDQCYQVLLNLCLNARDAMSEGGTITIGVALPRSGDGVLPPGDWLAVTVEDTGCGMDAHTLANAFEPFFTTKGELGTGLGLSSVYGIVQQSGGHVSAASTPGAGTTFTVLFPVAAPEPVAATRPERKPRLEARPATILVAEDDPAVRRVIVDALLADGHSVVDAENGQRALALARRHRAAFDLLCTDGRMPGISSRDLITGFLALFPDASVLVCSGHINEGTLLEGIAHQEFSFLPKPFTCAQLTAAVADSLARTRTRAARPIRSA